jgi:DNA-binding MarR family transcriptional regulator
MSRPTTGPFIGALLRQTWKGVREHINEAVIAAGYDDLNQAHLAIFRHPTVDGARPGELADHMQVSKQTVNDLLGDFERLGYLKRVVDPSDKRSRLIRLTAKGRKLEESVLIAAREAEEFLERALGRRRFTDLRDGLVDALAVLSDRDVAVGS